MTALTKIRMCLFALMSVVTVFALFTTRDARAAARPPYKPAPGRVRILDYENGSAAGLLLLELDKGLGGALGSKPAWHSLDSASADDADSLADETAGGAYELVVTGDDAFIRKLEERGAIKRQAALFTSELILVGPPAEKDRFEGSSAAEIMRRIFREGKLFFTPLNDAWMSAHETALWREADVSSPGENLNYVESGRGAFSLLLQVEDEAGFTLTTQGAFAQYMASTRSPEQLVKIASTGARRAHILCVIDHLGFRAERARNAEKTADWLTGESAAKIIGNFSLAGIKPFEPVKK